MNLGLTDLLSLSSCETYLVTIGSKKRSSSLWKHFILELNPSPTHAVHSIQFSVTMRTNLCLLEKIAYSGTVLDSSRVPRSLCMISRVHTQLAILAILNSPLDRRKNSSRVILPKPSINPPSFWNIFFLIMNGPCTILQFCIAVSSKSFERLDSTLGVRIPPVLYF